MARRIESLLRVISDMQDFELAGNSAYNQNLYCASDELSEAELDLVTAAVQEPIIPDFMCEENK